MNDRPQGRFFFAPLLHIQKSVYTLALTPLNPPEKPVAIPIPLSQEL